jgi:hypothetical protein
MNKDEIAGLVEKLDAVGTRDNPVEFYGLAGLAKDALTTLSARVETLEAALRRCFKGETQAVRNERVLEAIENYTRKALGDTDNG